LNIRQNQLHTAIRHLLARAALGLALAALALAGAAPLQAQISVLTNLTNSVPNVTRLTLSPDGGTLYGTTQTAGLNTGTVFSLPVTGGTPTVLGNFNGLNGSGPSGPVTLSGGILYGTNAYGGTSYDGTIYSVAVNGGTPTVLATFSGANGDNPAGDLVVVGNTIYGTTKAGGAYGHGEVFSLPVSGGSPTILTSFGLGDEPEAGLTLVGSTLCGTLDGGANGVGEVYSLALTGGTPTILGTFNTANGSAPVGRLTLSADGTTLFGTTAFGGANSEGTVFSLPVGGGTPTVLASFNGTNGMNPYGSVTQIGNTLYGTTSLGGANNDGEIFSVPIGGGTPTVVASFNGANGQLSYSDLTLSADGSALYGATSAGGPKSDGTLFSIPAPEPGSGLLLLLAVPASLAFRPHSRVCDG
jgi:uncharacterized repeat protein (TIGR03803 family)